MFKRKRERERGAIIVEATIALPVFMFAILTILSIVDICYIQSKIAIAMNTAAKEMSQYAYLYSTLNLSEHMSGEGGKSSEFMASFAEVLDTVSQGTSNISEDISKMFSDASDNAAGDSVAELAKNKVGGVLAEKLMKKNLVNYKGDSADRFLKRWRVCDGMDGLNFGNTTFLTDADQSDINIIVTYEVQVVKFFDFDYKLRFVQRAHTKAWSNGN